jgi:hypothetical protein
MCSQRVLSCLVHSTVPALHLCQMPFRVFAPAYDANCIPTSEIKLGGFHIVFFLGNRKVLSFCNSEWHKSDS